MGLDQAIRKVSPETAAKLMAWQESDQRGNEDAYPLAGEKYTTLMQEVWTGRKENHIHRAIEDITGQEVRNCDYLFLTMAHVKELVDRLRKVNEDHSLAETLLPTQDGFFFGGTQMDEWYFKDIESEYLDFRLILDDWDPDARYAYWAWW